MSDLKLDPQTHDLDLSSGGLELVTGDDAVVQKLSIRYQFFRGEWFLDQQVGIPYWTDIFIKNPNIANVNSIMRQTALSTPGIDELSEFTSTLDPNTRGLAISFSAPRDDETVLIFDQEFILP